MNFEVVLSRTWKSAFRSIHLCSWIFDRFLWNLWVYSQRMSTRLFKGKIPKSNFSLLYEAVKRWLFKHFLTSESSSTSSNTDIFLLKSPVDIFWEYAPQIQINQSKTQPLKSIELKAYLIRFEQSWLKNWGLRPHE